MKSCRWLPALSIVLTLACGASSPAARTALCPETPTSAPPIEAPTDVVEAERVPDEPTAPRVAVGTCDVSWLPTGVVLDVTDDETEALASAMRGWLDEGAIRELRVDAREGIAFAKSEDDLGGDPPYPTRTREQSVLACGLSSRWLLDHVRESFALHASPDFDGVACHENVCCYSGMEFMSGGILVARLVPGDEDARIWVIDSYVEIAEAALGEETIAANRAYVSRALTRERARTCPGEPAGLE